MAGRIRDLDWSATPLGPVAGWSERLKLMVEQVLASPLVSTLVCGPKRLLVYNDAAARQFGSHHPAALGRSLPDTFSAGWATVAPYYARAFKGETVMVGGQPLDTRSEGAATDVFDALLTPVRESDGSIAYVHMSGAEVGGRAQMEAALRESETRHRLLIESWAQAIWETDAHGVVTVDSPSWRAYTGQSLQEWLGYGWLNAIHPDDRAYAERQWREAIAARRLVNAEFRLRAPDGGWRWTNVLAAPVLGAGGTIKKWAGLNIDIDARKRAEAALRESEQRYRSLFGSMDEAYAVVGVLKDGNGKWVDFRFLEANRAFMAHTSMPYPVGRTATELLGSPNPRWTELYGQALDTGEPIRLEESEHTLGRTFDLNIFALDRAQHHVAVLFADVTGRKRAETALRESEERQAFLLKLSDTLRPLSDPADIQHAAMRLLAEKHDVMRAGYFDVHADGDTMTMAAKFERDAVPAPPQIRLTDYGTKIADAFHAGQTLCVRDTVAEAETEDQRKAYEMLGVRSWIIAPLVKGERLIAIVGVVSRTARDWTPADIQLVDDVAERTWAAVERTRAEAALRDSEERFRQFSEASPDILWARNADTLQWDHLSPAFEEIYGLSRGEALEGNDLRRWLELIEPDDCHEVMASMRRVRAGKRVTFEFRIRRPVDGQIRWLRNTDFPMRDQTGRVNRIGGIGQDITELKAIQVALTHSEQRLRILVEGVPQLVWRAIDHGDWTWASPQWVAFTGQPEPDSHHFGWLDPIHPDDREMARSAWDHAMNKGGFEVEYRIRNIAQDAYRWFQTRATPVRNAAGEIVEWLGTSTDIHDLRVMQDRHKVLVAELQHRTRNLMGVVRATAESTLRTSTDLADFGERYRDRLNALARVQGLLSRLEGVERIMFDELIQSELKAIGAIDGTLGKVFLNGPAGVALRSGTVQTFALALHELATNAVKYGALASPTGHLAVTWRLEHVPPENVPWLHVDWHESGVTMPPANASSQGTGQGRQLIERALPYQLGAKTTYVMGPTGVRCSIAVPVSSRTAVEETDDDK